LYYGCNQGYNFSTIKVFCLIFLKFYVDHQLNYFKFVNGKSMVPVSWESWLWFRFWLNEWKRNVVFLVGSVWYVCEGKSLREKLFSHLTEENRKICIKNDFSICFLLSDWRGAIGSKQVYRVWGPWLDSQQWMIFLRMAFLETTSLLFLF
jgi:hypothetical protein